MAFKEYDYYFTEIAEHDIDETIFYICDRLCNPEAASTFIDTLETKLAEVCKNPKKGGLVENEFVKLDEVRHFLVKNYIAYYTVDEDNARIVILRVVYSGRDQNKILMELT